MTEKRAAIDIGTNSTRLLLAEMHDGRAVCIEKTHNTVRTGEGVNRTGALCEAAMARTIKAIKEYVAVGEKWAGSVFCFATSAVREAANRKEFCARVLKECGVRVEILSGEEEAACGFAGVFEAGARGGIIDIGGGSTEVMFGTAEKIDFLHSFRLGCVRGLEQFGQNGAAVQAWAAKEFSKIILPQMDFYAIGGTGTSIAAIDLGGYDPKLVNGHVITIEAVRHIFEMLSMRTIAERRTIPGLEPKRADVILAGTAILLAFMQTGGLERVFASESDNLEGYLNRKEKT